MLALRVCPRRVVPPMEPPHRQKPFQTLGKRATQMLALLSILLTIYTPHLVCALAGQAQVRQLTYSRASGEGLAGRWAVRPGGQAATTTNVLSMTPPHCASERGKPATCPTARNRPRLERKRVFAQFEHVEPNCLPARSCSSSRNMHVRGVDAAVLSRCSAQTTSVCEINTMAA